MTEKAIEQWAVVEIFGHERLVGIIGEHQMGGESFIRVDVPKVDDELGFTKLFGKGAIYSITFVDENTGKGLAHALKRRPIAVWMFLDGDDQRLLAAPEEQKEALRKVLDELEEDEVPF